MKKTLGMIFGVLLLCFIVSFLPVAHAQQAYTPSGEKALPKIAINPTSGPAGTMISVKGDYFPDNTQVKIFMDNGFVGNGYVHGGSSTSFSEGTFTFYQNIPSDANPGDLVVIRAESTNATEYAFFKVVAWGDPSITPDPSSGPPGTLVKMSGKFLFPMKRYDLYFDTTLVKIDNDVLNDGTLGEVYFSVPTTALPGQHTITLKYTFPDGVPEKYRTVPPANFEVTKLPKTTGGLTGGPSTTPGGGFTTPGGIGGPQITLAPNHGPPGTSVEVFGMDFGGSNAIISVGGSPSSTTHISSDGNFFDSVTIPATAPPGPLKIQAVSSLSDANAVFTVTGAEAILNQEHYLIPGWVKNTAKWWSEGQTSDAEFATSIGFLVSNGIITLDSRSTPGSSVQVPSDVHIPQWIKNDASFWSTGAIDDSTFLQATQYMLNSNIITFTKNNAQTQTSPTTYDVSLKILDSKTGLPVDALVTLSGGSHTKTLQTDRDGIIHFSVSSGDYEVQVDSDNYQRLNKNLPVTGNVQQTLDLEPMQTQTGSSTTPPSTSNEPTTPPSTSNEPTTPKVSGSPPFVDFTVNSHTPCPLWIDSVILSSDQKGYWTVLNAPSWINISQGTPEMYSFYYNCEHPQNQPSPFATITFQFTSDAGVKAYWTMTITEHQS